MKNIDFLNGRYILITAHKRENFGEVLENICGAIKRLVEDFNDYPIHLNLAVRDTVKLILGNTKRIDLVDSIDV